MAGHGARKHRLIERFVAALLSSATVEAAAQTVGVSISTARAWLRQDDVIEMYDEARKQIMSQAIGLLQGAAGAAVQCLREIIENPDATPASRVSAARTILEMAMKGGELQDLEKRVVQLERLLQLEQEQQKVG